MTTEAAWFTMDYPPGSEKRRDFVHRHGLTPADMTIHAFCKNNGCQYETAVNLSKQLEAQINKGNDDMAAQWCDYLNELIEGHPFSPNDTGRVTRQTVVWDYDGHETSAKKEVFCGNHAQILGLSHVPDIEVPAIESTG